MTLKEFVQLWGSPLGIAVAALLFLLGYETWTDRRVRDVQAQCTALQGRLDDLTTGRLSFESLKVGTDTDFVQINKERVTVTHDGRESCRLGMIRGNPTMAEMHLSAGTSAIRIETVINDDAMVMLTTPKGKKTKDLRLDSRLGLFQNPDP